MTFRNLLIFFITLLLLFISSLVLTFITVFFYPFSHRDSGSIGNRKEDHTLRFLHYEKSTGKRKRGLVTFPYERESYFYEGEVGEGENDFYLISNFHESEYLCTGSCYCNDDENRRSGASALWKRGIVFLTGSITSILAHQKAKEYFESKCIEDLSYECNSISSSVDECSLMFQSSVEPDVEEYFEMENDDDKVEYLKRVIEEYDLRGHFLCTGHCMKMKTDEIREVLSIYLQVDPTSITDSIVGVDNDHCSSVRLTKVYDLRDEKTFTQDEIATSLMNRMWEMVSEEEKEGLMKQSFSKEQVIGGFLAMEAMKGDVDGEGNLAVDFFMRLFVTEFQQLCEQQSLKVSELMDTPVEFPFCEATEGVTLLDYHVRYGEVDFEAFDPDYEQGILHSNPSIKCVYW